MAGVMTRTGWIFGGAFFLVHAACAEQTDTVREWLDRMVTAVETMNYRGTVVYLRDDKIETLRVVHRAEGGQMRERIYSLNGAQREVLRDGGEIRCLFADDKGLVLHGELSSGLIPSLSGDRVADARDGYQFRLGGDDRVAGLDTQVIEILPRDEFRYGHRLWLERHSGMLLRSALFDAEGRVKQQLMFTEIELGADIADDELAPERVANGREYTTAMPSSKDVSTGESASWMPSSLPPGFHLQAVKKGDDGKHFEHLVFSDGFASFSVYLEPAGEAGTATGGLDTVGAVNVYTRPGDDVLITVVGEVPASTVEQIGRQFRPVK